MPLLHTSVSCGRSVLPCRVAMPRRGSTPQDHVLCCMRPPRPSAPRPPLASTSSAEALRRAHPIHRTVTPFPLLARSRMPSPIPGRPSPPCCAQVPHRAWRPTGEAPGTQAGALPRLLARVLAGRVLQRAGGEAQGPCWCREAVASAHPQSDCGAGSAAPRLALQGASVADRSQRPLLVPILSGRGADRGVH